jgi:hypothetical protein
MSVTTTQNEVRAVNLEPQTMRTPTFSTSDLVLSFVGGTARAAVGAGAAIMSSLQSLAQKAREEEARGIALAARQMALKPVSRRALEAEASQAATPAAALEQLLKHPLHVAAEARPVLTAKLQAVVQSGEKQAVIKFAAELADHHQAVVQHEVAAILRECAVAVGLTDITLRASDGYLMARLPGSQMVFRADVILNDAGGIHVATDTDGFHGTACEDTTAKIFAETAKRGLHVQGGIKQPKVRISQQNRRGALAPLAVRARHG